MTTHRPGMSRRRRSARRGAAAIETALVFSICLIPLLFAIMDYSWMFLQKSNVELATRAGLREGVTVSQATCDAVAVAKAREVMNELGLDGDGATVTPTHVGTSPTETLTLDITSPYTPLIGFPGMPFPANLSASGNMLLELQD